MRFIKHLRGKHDQRGHGRRGTSTSARSGGVSSPKPSKVRDPEEQQQYDKSRNDLLEDLRTTYSRNPSGALQLAEGRMQFIASRWPHVTKKAKGYEEDYQRRARAEYDALVDTHKALRSIVSGIEKATNEKQRIKAIGRYTQLLGIEPQNTSSNDRQQKQRQLDSLRHPTKGRYEDGVYIASQRGMAIARALSPNGEFVASRRKSFKEAQQRLDQARNVHAAAVKQWQASMKTPEDDARLQITTNELSAAERMLTRAATNPFSDFPESLFPFSHGLDVVQLGNVRFDAFPDAARELRSISGEVFRFVARFTPPQNRNGDPVTLTRTLAFEKLSSSRAYYQYRKGTREGIVKIDTSDVGVAGHEILHAIEDSHPELSRRVQEFYAYRTQNEAPVPMNTVETNSGYADGEVTRVDQWGDPYTGRVYSADVASRFGSTEVLSMIMTALADAPRMESADGALRTLEDEEHLAFFFDVLGDPDSWG